MKQYALYIIQSTLLLSLFFQFGCVDRYDFIVENKNQGVVIEAFISDKSFNDTKAYPSEGRYFTVKLSYTGNVTNERLKFISYAYVRLFSEDNMIVEFTESQSNPGHYILLDKDFKAKPGIKYSLHCTIGDNTFTSDWVSLPQVNKPLGGFNISEEVKQVYTYNGQGERYITDIDAVNLLIDIPENETQDEIYYIWNFDPFWTYTAPKPRDNSPIKYCWVSSQYYLSQRTLLVDKIGGYPQNLLYFQTQQNNRTYDYFSILVTQSIVNEDYYYYYKDLEAQTEKGGLYDQLPFNLPSNYNGPEGIDVFGYFSVHHEDATRWVFDQSKLSYNIYNDIEELCNINYGPPAPGDIDQCKDCRGYTLGNAVIYPPSWW